MKTINTLNSIKNVKEYIIIFPIQEQLIETNKLIEYHTNYNHARLQVNKKYATTNQLKDLRKSLS